MAPVPLARPTDSPDANAPDRLKGARVRKYLVLILFALTTLVVVFNAFSFYVARRDLDAELVAKKSGSLEHLGVLARQKRALVLTSLEGRCLERTELTMFRIADTEQNGIGVAYAELLDAKAPIVNLLASAKDLLQRGETALDWANGEHFRLDQLDQYSAAKSEETAKLDSYRTFKTNLDKARDVYVAVGHKHEPLLKEVEELMLRSAKPPGSSQPELWRLDTILTLSDRNQKAGDALKKIEKESEDFAEILDRYGVWTSALTGGEAASPVLDDMAFQIASSDKEKLGRIDCGAFADFYAAVNGKLLRDDPIVAGANLTDPLGATALLRAPSKLYDAWLLKFFSMPPAAQTLFVTMALGALGAISLNILRMSHVGGWGGIDDPLWGEILVGPLLGALGAFGVFLLGSAGLMLTSEGGSAHPPSAYFIGLLGFVSGFRYDRAFWELRQAANRVLSGEVAGAVAAETDDDRSLAALLTGHGAELAGELATAQGLAASLTAAGDFTLLIPCDAIMGALDVAHWRRLRDTKDGAFEAWLKHRQSAGALNRGAALTAGAIVAMDGEVFKTEAPEGAFTIGGALVQASDLSWKRGVIHVLAGDAVSTAAAPPTPIAGAPKAAAPAPEAER